MAQPKNTNDIERGIEPVKRQITAGADADYEFAPRSVYAPADSRMRGQNFNGTLDLQQSRFGKIRSRVLECLRRVGYPRHRKAFGRRAFLPRTLANR